MKLDDGHPIDWIDSTRLVGKVLNVKCSRCKQHYTPDENDVSLNRNLYYKLCKNCRAYCLACKKRAENLKTRRQLPTSP